ncbi:MAG: ATP-binding protein, partial [Campylobacter sp.]
YGTIAKLERENFIRFLSKAGEPTRAKKLYFSHFNMREILTSKKDFSKKFANVLFCELLGLNTPIFYTKELDFYLPALKTGVLVIPFSDADIIFLKFRKILSVLKRLGITSLKVVSMANSGRLEIEGIRCDVIPFHEFALSF